MARPGTVDYSKWERLAAELSSDEETPTKKARTDIPLAPPPQPSPFHLAGARSGPAYGDDDDYDSEEEEEEEHHPVNLQTGTCAHCGNEDAEKRCSRCQAVWFCGRACQALAWPSHKVHCFARAETETWWGKLSNSDGLDGAAASNKEPRDVGAMLQERLEFRRAVAATHERRRAAALAAAQAAAARERVGMAKGGDAKGGKGQEEREETCAVCQCEFTLTGDSGEGLCCPSSHFLCSECTGVFVQSVLNDLQSSYPPKCSMCRAELPAASFERQLNPQQQKLFAEFVAQHSLAVSERMMKCHCGYMEVRTDDPVLWWCQVCKRGECQVCNKELPRPQHGDLGAIMASQLNSEGDELDQALRPHIVGCAALRDAKRKVDAAFEGGQTMPCPQCKLAGRKDDACTHMTCNRCHTDWCYVCGLSVADADKKPPRGGRPANDIFLHNADWEVNPRRCPMYLTQILEVDPAWLGHNWSDGDEVDDDKCLEYFHRWRLVPLWCRGSTAVLLPRRAFLRSFLSFLSSDALFR
eukprot:TRINITY_DN30114_c0_g1_i2.p1 TRINITY_DN30114_c0_g1~~TRINITY_DN30114_c0_g1_i2.p1  ORF type:complete len:526 (+),score=113.10 TRINITY_DN30114_c0_g1_i2:130-1707(+)